MATSSSPTKASTGTEPRTTATITSYSTSKLHTATTASHNAQSHPPQTQSSGISTGAAIGIGIAIAVFVIALLCALGFFCYRRHAVRKRAGEHIQPPHAVDVDVRSESPIVETKVTEDYKGGVVVVPYELCGEARAGELETSANRHELDPRTRGERIYELPAESGKRKFFDYTRSSWYSASSVEEPSGHGSSAV